MQYIFRLVLLVHELFFWSQCSREKESKDEAEEWKRKERGRNWIKARPSLSRFRLLACYFLFFQQLEEEEEEAEVIAAVVASLLFFASLTKEPNHLLTPQAQDARRRHALCARQARAGRQATQESGLAIPKCRRYTSRGRHQTVRVREIN